MIFFLHYIISFNLNVNSYMNYQKYYMTRNRNLNLLHDNKDVNLEINNYKKTITHSNFLKEEKIMKIFNYKNLKQDNLKVFLPYIQDEIEERKKFLTLYKEYLLYKNLSLNSILIHNITDFITTNIKPRNLKNEILYLITRKTKVYIHIELLFPGTNIYHIGVTFKSLGSNIRYDIRGINLDNIYCFFTDNLQNELYSKTLFWDYTDKTLGEIIEYEKNIEHKYILGIYDCRHYVRNLTIWACNKPTPVWKLIKLVD